MNERIKELIKQATSIEHGVDNGFDMVIFDKEKFAELILQECKLFCGHDSEGVSAMFKHFGVEE